MHTQKNEHKRSFLPHRRSVGIRAGACRDNCDSDCVIGMTREEEREVIRVCGPDYEESDIPAYIRNRKRFEVREIPIPIIQGRDNYTNAAADYAERISR